MKKRIAVTLVSLLTLFLCVACNGEVEYLKTKVINRDAEGNLSTYTTYEYDKNNNLVKQSEYNDDNKVMFYSVREYDDGNNLISYKSYDSDDSIRSHTVYKHDEQGREIESISYDSNEIKQSITSRTYDESGYADILYDRDSNQVSTTIVTLNENGDFLRREFNYYQSSSVMEYEYDKDGYLIKRSFRTDEMRSHTLYFNDSKGNVIESEEYGPEGNIIWYVIYTYDKNGNLVGEEFFNPNDELTGSIKHEYKKARR